MMVEVVFPGGPLCAMDTWGISSHKKRLIQYPYELSAVSGSLSSRDDLWSTRKRLSAKVLRRLSPDFAITKIRDVLNPADGKCSGLRGCGPAPGIPRSLPANEFTTQVYGLN